MITSVQPSVLIAAIAKPQSLLPIASSDPHDRGILGNIKDEVLNGVRKTNEFLDKHPTLDATVGTSFAFMRGLQAFPKFIYPSIHGATAAEKAFILQTLDTLPLKDVNCVKSIFVVESIPHASGVAYDANVTNLVKLARDQISISPEWFREVTIHETAHTKDYSSQWFNHFGRNSGREPWGEAPYITNYAKTNEYEDYADSYAKYHVDPEKLKATAPEKYRIIQEQEQQNFVERLMDREAFRETGKWMGDQLGTKPWIRIGANVIYWASGGIQVLKGLDSIRLGDETGNPLHHYEGVMDVAAGMLFASRIAALGGLVAQGAHRALNGAVKRGEITGADADAAVRLASDPVERGIRFVGDRLGITDAFTPLSQKVDHRGRALGVAIGGALGSLAGGIAGPYAGVLAGYSLAGPVGGATGLVVGAIAGYALGASVGGRVGGAVVRAAGG